MEPNYNGQNIESNPTPQPQETCPVCHQPILPQYYYCPNCGNKVHREPLSTSVKSQISIYLFSAILPVIGFLFVKRWPGIKYAKSKDPKERQIGQIAWTIVIISTILVIYFAYVATNRAVQSALNSMNMDLGAF